MFYKKNVFLEISLNSQKNACARVSFLIKLQAALLKKRLAQVLYCEFFKICKDNFFTEHGRLLLSDAIATYAHI